MSFIFWLMDGVRLPYKRSHHYVGESVWRKKNKKRELYWVWLLWQYGLWSFQTGGTKIEIFLPKNQHTQRKLFNFENWVSGELSKSAKIWLSKSILYIKNHWNLSDCFFIEEYESRSTFFVIGFFFWWHQFLNNFIF